MIRLAKFEPRQDGLYCVITEGNVHDDMITEFYIGDWTDAQGFVNKLQRSIFMKDANI